LVKITRRWLRAALAPVTFGAGAALIVGTLAGRPSSPHHGSSIQMSMVALPAAVATRHQVSRRHMPPRTLATVRAYRPRGGGESLPGKVLVARPSGTFPGRGLVPDAGPPAPGTPATRGLPRAGPDAARRGGFLGGQRASELPGPRSVHGR
jgi:hypothetical protein